MSGYSLGDTSVNTTLKYGLNPAAKKKKRLAGAKPLSGPIAAFAGGDEDSDDEPADSTHKSRGNLEVLRQQAAAKRDQKARELHSAVLAEDPSIFDYDGHFDAFRDARAKKLEAADGERVERKSRYVTSLMAKQKEREREESIIYERRLLKEREKEDHMFGDKDKFVTAAYRAKLEEDAKWVGEEKLRDAREAQDDVTKKGTDFMSGFYHNLLSRNQAMGAQAAGAKGGRVTPEPEPPALAEEEASRAKAQAEEEGRRRRRAMEEEMNAAVAAAAGADDADAKRRTYDRTRREAGRGIGGGERGGLEVRAPPASAKNADETGEAPETSAQLPPDPGPGPGPGPGEMNPHERRNKEDAVSAAKQRYLERKRKAAGGQ